ncbi:hypothetical protein MTR67_002365 [Solanum verrucosum]|uniref:C2 domain-containing protein n=1 Tax=Solanum verrucosum TaxID=315347 RepID=A0AAF0TD86_SOLVR|nr:hypothetical protein MTR67_002365 [Solanum verrucosum]
MGTVRKLVVEVIEARNLLPKDGHGTSSPYVLVDFYGQRRKTRTVTRDLSPQWNEMLEFNVGKPSDVFGDMLELDVYHDKSIGPTTRNNFLGRIRLSATQFVKKGEEALIYYPLEKKYWFSWISGEIGLKIYFVEQLVVPQIKAEPKQAPPAEPTEAAPEGEKPNSIEEEPPAQVVENPTTVEAEPPAKEAENPTSVLMDPHPPQDDEFTQVKRSSCFISHLL